MVPDSNYCHSPDVYKHSKDFYSWASRASRHKIPVSSILQTLQLDPGGIWSCLWVYSVKGSKGNIQFPFHCSTNSDYLISNIPLLSGFLKEMLAFPLNPKFFIMYVVSPKFLNMYTFYNSKVYPKGFTFCFEFKKQGSSRKHLLFALLTMPKPWTVWITTNCGKFFKRWEYQTTWPASWGICVQIKKQQLELDIEQTGSKSGKEYVRAKYCYPVYLNDMQDTVCEMPGRMKHKLESRLLGAVSVTSDMQMTPLLWQKVKKN